MSAEFVDELPARYFPTNWKTAALIELAAELRANPGHWAKYPTKLTPNSARSRAGQIKAGKVPAFEHNQFEAAVRDGILYVRAVPL